MGEQEPEAPVAAVAPMTTPAAAGRPWRTGDRVAAGLLGLVMGAATGSLTLVWAWIALWDIGCPVNLKGNEVVESAALMVAFSSVWGLGWSITGTLLAVAGRGRGLRARMWLVAPVLCSAIALGSLGVALAVDPGPRFSEACQGFD